MKKKIVIFITAIAFTLTLTKTGYAYYENLSEKNGPEQASVTQLNNIKDRTTYEKELNVYVEDGRLSEEDKEYYLSLYDNCAGAFSDNSSELENNIDQDDDNSDLDDEATIYENDYSSGNFPSCH